MWKTIKYSKTGKPLIDVNEQGVFYSYRTRQIKPLKKLKRSNHTYLYWSTEDGQNHYAHREVAKAFPEICGEWFEGCEVHHKDGNPHNNEASNLIVCTKEQHLEYHRLMKEKKKIKIQKENPLRIEELIEQLKANGDYSVNLYCRRTKMNKEGYSPIEIGFYQKGVRKFYNTFFKAKPSDFENKIYPEGLMEYFETYKK